MDWEWGLISDSGDREKRPCLSSFIHTLGFIYIDVVNNSNFYQTTGIRGLICIFLVCIYGAFMVHLWHSYGLPRFLIRKFVFIEI